MSSEPAWWAKAQTAGPVLVAVTDMPRSGLAAAPEPGGQHVWLLPAYPEGTGHAVLEEIGAAEVPLEQPIETRRVMAIVVTLCWHDQSSSPWPGVPVPTSDVRAVFSALRGPGDADSALRLVMGALNRLHAAGWVLLEQDRQSVRLGPRVVLWSPSELVEMREICRDLHAISVQVLGQREP
jgi:hypothetical protein